MNITKVISILGSIALARIFLLLVSISLFVGSVFYNLNSEVFVPLNTLSLLEWLQTYGQNNLAYTWWFYLFIVFMFLLGMNTFFCTLDRTWIILSRYNKLKKDNLVLLLLSPHIMHFSFIILLLGYFMLYSFGINSYNNILRKDCPVTIHETDIKISLLKFSATPYKSRLYEGLNGKFIDPRIDLEISEGDTMERKVFGLNNPVYFRGYSIHLNDFTPKSGRSMSREISVNLTIRKNAGIPLFIMGIILFITGTFLYIIYNFKNTQRGDR